MFTEEQLDKAVEGSVADAEAAKDEVIAAMYTQEQLEQAVTDAETAKDEIIASMFTEEQLGQAVADAEGAKDEIIASMFTEEQLDQAVSAAIAEWDLDGDGRIGLLEIIYYLQVVSGRERH